MDTSTANTVSGPGVHHGREEISATPTPKDVAEASQRKASADRGRGDGPAHYQPKVFVLDKKKRPLNPTSPARARELLEKGKARVHKRVPFTIRLTDRLLEDSEVHGHVICIDPGSKTTGIAVARETTEVNTETGEVETTRTAVSLMELVHRGLLIKKRLQQRAQFRRNRRSRNLRHRAPRFRDRTRRAGWLPPSLQHRVDSTMSWVRRLIKLVPVTGLVYESVRFDMQKTDNPEISGTEYQQGTLAGFEVREYLLAKYDHQCVYCDARDVPLNLDHVVPKASGGSNRVSNLVLACIPCNQTKGKRPVEEFVTDPKRLARIKWGLKQPLRDAAAVSATRRALHRALAATGLPVRTGTGAKTKFNRARLGVPKEHCLDALCVGDVEYVTAWPDSRTIVTSTGRGVHQRTTPNKHGFPRLQRPRKKRHYGFQTGDLVRAVVPRGKHTGTHIGRAAVRTSGNFSLNNTAGKAFDVNHRHLRLLQHGDGYAYQTGRTPEHAA